MILVLVANTNSCKIYDYASDLKLLAAFNDPEAKLQSKDLGSDRPGRYQAGESGRGAYSPNTDPKEVEIENLSRDIAKKVNELRNQHQIKKIILIAEVKMDGYLLEHFNKNVKELITNNIKKDIVQYAEKELLSFLKEHAQYADV